MPAQWCHEMNDHYDALLEHFEHERTGQEWFQNCLQADLARTSWNCGAPEQKKQARKRRRKWLQESWEQHQRDKAQDAKEGGD